MYLPYTIRFNASRYFEHDETEWTDESALAKLAGIPNANTARDIESGRDAQISTVQLVAKALGCDWIWWKSPCEAKLECPFSTPVRPRTIPLRPVSLRHSPKCDMIQ